MSDLYCGAWVDGGLCLHVEDRHKVSRVIVNGAEGVVENATLCIDCAGQLTIPILATAHGFIPAYVRCPECNQSPFGRAVELRERWSTTTVLDERADGVQQVRVDAAYGPETVPCRCATTPTPGFIPVSEEVRT